KSLREVYPAIDDFNLLDYKVRVLEGSKGMDSKVRVLIETGNGEKTWSTVGVSENIIEASWQALADSLEYGLRQAAGR
ncbi:MAG TPA: citramalate synthase, partial [Clostridia bacterium]|nr:citramalate synthase [Clostridia bacterium]